MIQLSDLYAAFMLSGFPDCLRGALSGIEPETAGEDGIVPAVEMYAEPPCPCVSSGAC